MAMISRTIRLSLSLALVAALTVGVRAQSSAGPLPMTGPADPRAVPLSSIGSGGEPSQPQWVAMPNQRWERNVTQPSIIPILAPPDKANGAAVLLAPGGGFLFLSMDNEGYNVAKRLNALGVSAFILQYRTLPTPRDNEGFKNALAGVFDKSRPGAIPVDPRIGIPAAVADAQAALRYIRAHAAAYHIDPKRLGMVGFSAGAMTSFATVMADQRDALPNYFGVIYGPTNIVDAAAGAKAQVPADAPPLFNGLALDDRFFGSQNLSAIEAWRMAGKSVEFHLYQGGGHGFASFPDGHTSDHWFDVFSAWMKAMGYLNRAGR